MKRGFRLRKSADVKRVRRHGQRFAHPMLTLHVFVREGIVPQVGVVAGRTVGGAVQRNRAKRVMRAAIQPLLAKMRPDLELLLIARPSLLEAKSTQVREILERLLQKADGLKKE